MVHGTVLLERMNIQRGIRQVELRARLIPAAIALGACVAYFVGSKVGLQLRFQPATTSVLWPPNAILTSILVLNPPRRWPLVLLATLPAHLWIQMQTDWPLTMILVLFVTNCSEALLAAWGLYLLSDVPTRLDTLRRLAAFLLCAVAVAPLLSSFADAFAVMWFRSERYWQVWQTRLFSNTLAQLTVVPAMVGGVLVVRDWWNRRLNARYAEATILGLGLCAIGWLDVSNQLRSIPALRALSSQNPLAIQLPLLMWAAMRFGPTGAGLSILTTSLLTAWAVVHGLGPFRDIPPSATQPALTLSLIVVAVTLLCLAALVEERRQSQHALKVQLRFEGLLSRLSAALVTLPSPQIDRAYQSWLGQIGTVLGVDSLTVFAASDGSSDLTAVHSWSDPALNAASAATIEQHLPWAHACLEAQNAVILAHGNAGRERDDDGGEFRDSAGIATGAAIPLVGGEHALGALAFGSTRADRWSLDLMANMRLVAEVLASALTRQRSDDALRESELMKSAILQSLTSGVAVIDASGRLLQFNERWLRFARVCDWMEAPLGANLLDNCRRAFERGDPNAGGVVVGVAAVLAGARERFIIEHRTEAGPQAEWWSLSAVPLNRNDGGALLICADITELRRAELEAQRSRQELAHVSRVSTVGEMTASLAHQLNQPLTAIMTNAQVAGRLLDSTTPDVVEVREILRDIVSDDQRASDVIQGLRQLLRKGELEMTRVNLTSTVREVVDLVASEAIIRNVVVSLDFVYEPVFVRGDRVQLQQVILNLLHNAMEAMADQERQKTIAVGCRASGGPSVIVTVRDSGPGLRSGTEHMVFEPFYTTKAGGMGMGLSIVRSIVEAHGGSIRATNALDCGALFELRLPLVAGRTV